MSHGGAAPVVCTLFICGLLAVGCVGQEPRSTSVGGSDQAGLDEDSLSDRIAAAAVVDLSYPFDEQTIYWPTAGRFELIRESAGYTDAGYFYAANRFAAAEHGGTHLDSPIHFFEGGDTTDEIPLSKLIGKGVVVDVSDLCADNPDFQITIDDLERWEEEHHRALTGSLVLLKTGWGRFWPHRETYLGTAETGEAAVPKLHFPGLAPEAAEWLTEERSILAVGIDTASIDFGQSRLFGSHVALFKHNTPVFENVANLNRLPPFGFILVALPMKIGGGSGGPLRIVALIDRQ